jgi:LysR family transcriptional regulator, hydrogen peroxide-inducible genes activator
MRFVSFLSRFRAMHPGIDLTLTEDVPGHLSELLLAGKLEAAIMAQADGFSPPFSAQPIYVERFVVVCSLTYRFAQRNTLEMAKFDGGTYFYRINCEFRDHL